MYTLVPFASKAAHQFWDLQDGGGSGIDEDQIYNITEEVLYDYRLPDIAFESIAPARLTRTGLDDSTPNDGISYYSHMGAQIAFPTYRGIPDVGNPYQTFLFGVTGNGDSSIGPGMNKSECFFSNSIAFVTTANSSSIDFLPPHHDFIRLYGYGNSTFKIGFFGDGTRSYSGNIYLPVFVDYTGRITGAIVSRTDNQYTNPTYMASVIVTEHQGHFSNALNEIRGVIKTDVLSTVNTTLSPFIDYLEEEYANSGFRFGLIHLGYGNLYYDGGASYIYIQEKPRYHKMMVFDSEYWDLVDYDSPRAKSMFTWYDADNKNLYLV